ncbi:MAG: YajQ family cyclic di-GMP-binding protein [Nitrosomonas sp.]|nr:YajQ family cyclic di-GMP-binding protein [Nitrosomonas sp.]
MPSFDIVSEVDGHEVRNAVDQTNKEVSSRFDFKGTDARVEQVDFLLNVFADDEFKLDQVLDVLRSKLTKRKIDVRCLEKGQIEKISGNKVKQEVTVKTGLNTELAKKIVKILKENKLKVQASIQGDAVRVSSVKKDVLQEAIQIIKKVIIDFPLQYQNFRD